MECVTKGIQWYNVQTQLTIKNQSIGSVKTIIFIDS